MKNATHLITATFGAVMAMAGIEHGIGEMLQGNVVPERVMILSWPDAAFFHMVSGEPAMTIVPNLLITGILAIIFSLAYLIWSIFFVQRKNGGLVLILLAVIMLLVGAGIFPPILGIMIGILGTRINTPLTWQRSRLFEGLRSFLSVIWRWCYTFCIIAWLLLFPGLNMLGYFLRVDNAALTVSIILIAIGSLGITILCGLAHDAQRRVSFAGKGELSISG